MLLNNLTLFLRIIEKGGMAAAGRELGLSPASVSERLVALESHYGARLLNRTTRALSLTEEGQILAEGARRILAEAEDLETRIRLGVERISGPIRLSAPIDLGRNRIAAMLSDFMEIHPEVRIELYLDDAYVDMVAQGIDLAVRYGQLNDSTLHARKLASSRRLVCAAPCYLKKNGTPAHPDDLNQHQAVLMRFGTDIDNVWRFMINGRERKILMRATCTANDGELVRTWCRAGHGLALKSEWDIAGDLKSGALVSLLAPYAMPPSAVQIIYPSGHSLPRRVRALIDFLAKAFNSGR